MTSLKKVFFTAEPRRTRRLLLIRQRKSQFFAEKALFLSLRARRLRGGMFFQGSQIMQSLINSVKIPSFILIIMTLLSACAPAPTPTPAPIEAANNLALETVDQFFATINAAKDQSELGKPWDMLTLEEQCNPPDQCTLDRFQDI